MGLSVPKKTSVLSVQSDLVITALLLIMLSWWSVLAAKGGLIVRSLEREGVPMVYVAPQHADKIPGVLVAHGFAGSKQLMLGYAHALAHSGYAVMLWNFGGHGANSALLKRFGLQQDLDVAYAALLEQPEVDPASLAFLGHSMGSGAVMQAGIRNAERFSATVAISPTDAKVTPQTPRNLLLQAGSGEGHFIDNAKRLLQAAGGENQNLAEGQGRSLVIVPSTEHIKILFSDASHQAALRWLNASFNRPQTSNYTDRRMAWYGLHLVGWLVVLGTVAPTFTLVSNTRWAGKRLLRSWGGLFLAQSQRGKAQTVYQELAAQAQAIYQVRETKDIDQRIAFLMQEQKYSPSQITQVLAQSPDMQELAKRDRSYVQSYSQFCQAQAAANQPTWQVELDQYRRAIEVERQRQEQHRIALERQQRQQQERQDNLKLLGQWQEAAIALDRPPSYVKRIQEITADYQQGLPLSEQAIAARQQDLAVYQRQLRRQQQRGFSL